MSEETRPHDERDGEYTDSEVPVDAAVPKHADADVNDGDWDGEGDAVIVEEVDAVIVERDGEYTDTDFDADRRPDRA
jgi:hypothetical protein